MKIAGVKAVRDPPALGVQHSSPSLHRPIARQSPMIEPQLGRGSIDLTPVECRATRRRKVLRALIAEIVLRSLQVAPISGGFRASAMDRNQLVTDVINSGLGQQLLNNHFRPFVIALTEFMMSNVPLC